LTHLLGRSRRRRDVFGALLVFRQGLLQQRRGLGRVPETQAHHE
jgi:hypothetical protein